MESIVLYLIRHGVTNFNEEGRVQGESDSCLTETGQRDVLKVCEKLKDNAIDKNSYKLISSPLLRTVESSAIISNCFGLDIVEDNRLVELKRGVIEGKTKDEFSENDLEYINVFKKNPWSERVPGGESFTDLKIRIDEFLERIRKSSSNLIIVSHGFVIRMIVFLLNTEGLKYDAIKAPHNRVYRITLKEGITNNIEVIDV